MSHTSILSPAILQAALAKARAVTPEVALSQSGLNAPLGDEAMVAMKKIWDKIEAALGVAYREGRLAAQPYIDEVEAQLALLKERADQVRAMLLERLGTYQRAVIDGALARVQAKVRVGDVDLPVQSIGIDQKMKVSGSLKASLSEVCSFVAEGEITVSAKYGSSTPA